MKALALALAVKEALDDAEIEGDVDVELNVELHVDLRDRPASEQLGAILKLLELFGDDNPYVERRRDGEVWIKAGGTLIKVRF